MIIRQFGHTRKSLMTGACLTAVAALAIGFTPARAQDAAANAAPADSTEVVVTGVRKSLKSAQQIKRNADTVVDSITSEDIGSFPDKSVAEALQRVAGITVVRFNGTDDTSHFSAEPSGVLVRGLMQVRSEFNGRDTFSANSSRGLSWGDVSPELMAGVDTYKNQTADLIEGGIAGSINLRTRLPFDSKSRLLVVNASTNYGDLAKKEGYDVSAIWSDRWSTDLGEFGVMANFAVSQVYTGSQGIQYDRMGIFDVPSVFGPGLKYIPSVVYNRENVYDRNRKGVALAAQWRSNDGSLLLTAQYNRSQYRNSWQEYAISGSAFSVYGLPTSYVETNPDVVKPANGSAPFTFDGNGNFLTGQMSTLIGYLADDDAASATNVASIAPGVPLLATCHSWSGCATGADARRGAQIQSASNYLKNNEYTEDVSVNLKWDISDTMRASFDVQHVKSEVANFNANVNMNTYGNMYLDTTGKYPVMTLTDTNVPYVNLATGGFTNAHNYNYYSASDHAEESSGTETAARADFEWALNGTWLDTLKVGARYADRDQTVRWGAYNWANITSTWGAQSAVYNADLPIYGTNAYQTHTFNSDFFRGNVMDNQSFVFFNMDHLKSSAALGDNLGNNGTTRSFSGFYPVCSNAGYRAGEISSGDFGCYTAPEIHPTSEKTKAAYAMLKFGGHDATLFGFGVSGNIGVRYVETRNESVGGILLPQPFSATYTAAELQCTRTVNTSDPQHPYNSWTPGCVISASDLAFNNNAYIESTAKATHHNVLPSFNIKFDLNDEWVLRFAASKAMSRPDLGYMKNYASIARQGSPVATNATDPRIVYDSNGLAVGYNFSYQSNAANPYLKPMTADQFDLSIEHYFASVGSFTFTGFSKKFYDYIQYGSYDLTLTNNGVTKTVKVNGPVNGDGAAIKGFEVAYQRFFDFLPGPFNGLGIQANYTHVVNNGITNTNLISESADGGTNTGGGGLSQASDSINPHALEGISKDSYNLIFMYEKPKFSARLAYNWRSRFLVTSVDCCIGFPIWQDAAGYLDGSLKYRINDRVELSLEGSNLLDTDTVLKQQVDQNGTLAPNAWFKNDRRIQAGVQMKF
ncbi:TonB-dependent receptor [Asticcacaulis sp. 201]|uniref:TonB-dependent receptor n=1 Tax=Asticcacaulis sp. 201 TaxID=3028787 RepID=UPI00291669EB|nr:TonB-dependent receptor [Asticcacaulis sp. 201]MDV6329915.1 TonB-dependent receptor [Asticcacaulis sp. 201]